MKSTPVQRRLPAAVAAAFSLSASLALAAEPPAPEDIENIVVTAQSRQQSERDVPIAMQVVDMRQITDLGAENLSDINGYVPGFTVDGSQPTQPNFALRGIGTGDFGVGTDAPVGVYVDGVYTGKTGGSLLNFNDVQRVEVLKGPQGTLFGRNSAAGAISILANEPEQATDGEARVRYGRFNTIAAEAMFNTALGDTSALRVSAVSKNSDGWVTNEATGQKMGGDGSWGTRTALKWSPAADTRFIASWEHEKLDQAARPAFGLVQVAAGTAPPGLPSAGEFVNPLNTPLRNDAPNRESRTLDGLTLRAQTLLAGLTFTSTSAYRHFRSYNSEDNDGTANPATYLNTVNAEVNASVQQEFKLASQDALRDWIAGVSLYHAHADQVSTVNINTNSIDTLYANTQGGSLFAGQFGGLGLGNPWQEQMINTSRTNSYALYGDVIWHLDTTTNLTTGLRWTGDRKEVRWFVPPYQASALDAQFLAATPGLFGQALTFGQAIGAATASAPLTNIIFQNAALAAAQPVSASHSWTDLSPRLVLDHKLGAHTMAFASVARGYQAGGYDVFNPLARFEPEHMSNYELGFKSALPEQHASLEGSLFRYRFTNLQSITLVNAGTLPVYDISNSNQSAWGMDLAGRMEVAHDLSVFGTGEYLRQRYDQYAFVDHFTGHSVSLDGQPVGTPLFTVAAGARLGWPVLGGKGEFVLQGTHTSATRCNTQITEEFGCLSSGAVHTGEAQSRVDLRLAWSTEDHRYGVALLANNALDKRYVMSPGGQATWTLGTPYAAVTPPRFVAVEFNVSL